MGTSLIRAAVVVPALFAALSGQAGPAYASHAVTYQVGDVFAGTGQGGGVQWRHSNGTLHSVLTTQATPFTTGMAFDNNANLYVTGFNADNVSKLSNAGVLLPGFGTGYNCHPESIVFDVGGNAYVGQADCSKDILKFSPLGMPLASYDVATETRGSDWIDLAADQCTIYYTSEGTTVFRYDVCTNMQLAPFATGLPGTNAFALRVLGGGGLLVADRQSILRLNSGGSIVQTYDVAGHDFWFAMNLDPDGQSFWSGDLNGDVYKFDIASGGALPSFNVGAFPPGNAFGITVFGERTAAKSIDHYLCYKAKATASFTPVMATLADQFETGSAEVKKPKALCPPANKNGEGIFDQNTHEEAYQIKPAARHVRQLGVRVLDQFGELTVDTVKADRLLVPTTKGFGSDPPPPAPGAADHYKCYKVKISKGTPKFPKTVTATVVDQFENRVYDVKKPRRLCVPVDKNGEGIVHPAAHLMCYQVKRAKGQPKHARVVGQLHTNNQFGPGRLDTVKEEELCVPALKNPPAGP